MKKLTVIVICLSVILSLVSCATTGTPAGSTTETQIVSTQPVETTDPYADDLPEKDYEGYEFTICSFENINVHSIAVVEGENGEYLNDALYKRNKAIEDRFNIKLKEIPNKDGSSIVKKSVQAGDNAFDIATVRCTDAVTYWQQEIAYNYNDLPVIDLSKPYWDQSINPMIAIGGVQYTAVGAFNLTSYDLTYALLFNKKMIEDYSLDNPYELVKSGKWTFDAMDTMMKAVVSDVNGDSKMDETDRYGYLAHPKQVLPDFLIGAGELFVSKDDKDIPVLSMNGDRFNAVFNKVFEITYDNNAWYRKDGTADVPEHCITMFSNGQSLFMDVSFFYIESLRGAETDFGILPYPKFDETQADYHSRLTYYIPTVVPVTAPDLERTCTILEALNSESARTVIPAYYEVVLKTKYSRDEESADMLDLIFAKRVADLGDTTLCDKIRDAFVYEMYKKDDRNLTSRVERAAATIDAFIKKLPISGE